MFDFEDEFIIIEHNGVSWLIWIQLLVIFLIVALYCLSVFAFDCPKNDCDSGSKTAVTAIASSSTSQLVSDNVPKNLPKLNFGILSNRSRKIQVVDNQSIKGERPTSTTNRRITQVGEGIVEGEGSQETQLDLHPCSYFRLAKSAFLRCLGLDSSSENSVSDERKREESRKAKES